MSETISLTYYSDMLCVWAYIAQARVDEVEAQFGDQLSVDYRFCSVFGDTTHKIGVGWSDRGGYPGFAEHVRQAVASFDHVCVHPDLWLQNPPASSTPAHLVMKAVQRVDESRCEALLREIRSAFFERCEDIGRWSVLESSVETVGASVEAIREAIDSGVAYADLEADLRDRQTLMVQGSPTFLLNDGRQKLYGNVGYGVIEANIKELLRSPVAGAASWC